MRVVVENRNSPQYLIVFIDNMGERYNIHSQLEHLQSKYIGTGHADTTKFEWLKDQKNNRLMGSDIIQLQQTDIHCDPYNEIFSTVPTVGVNIAQINLAKNKRIRISELGGSMAAIWHMHYEGCVGIIYVIDASNMQQISCACVLLLEIIKHDLLKNAKIAIVLNKTDVNNSVQIAEIKYLLRLEDISQHAEQEITVIETSCLTGKGLKILKQWLLQFCL
ncbi:ADP-ribosylation factor-like protein 16 [Nephila pilipes]|uniref:ADP-ribosylation factor-like protein 16 n=1 Tax=Nephila pilipes TaxID=299642 RepID=A0A8X6PDH2_NEPPI|nr:ADP-ribosylation factor-like protein 16 [Nephila pilipes]